MKNTTFRFFKNTPLIDFQNTIHFKTNAERDNFFLNGGHYEELEIGHPNFNFIRDRSTAVLDVSYDDMRGVNYCTFDSDFENERFYAYVINYEYLNEHAVRVNLLVDAIMTYTQGSRLEGLSNLNIQRQHLSNGTYDRNIWQLKNNGDVLKTHTKNYFKTEKLIFDDLIVLMKSSAKLTGFFGSEDNPIIKTSNGREFDKVTSPLDLYVCDLTYFNQLMDKLADFPWIAQNITSLNLIPRIFMEGNLTKITFTSNESLSGFNHLYRISGQSTQKGVLQDGLDGLSYTLPEAMTLFGLDPIQERHLLRSEYTTTELYNYSGGQLFIDNGQLNDPKGLTYTADIITGYHTEMKVYVDNYRAEQVQGYKGGAYVNDSLAFTQFDDVPMLINTGDLAMAKNANQRALAESKLVTNRIGSVMDGGANLKDRFFNAASLASNLNPTNLFGKFSDEHDFYNQQKAEMADMALETPSISAQTNGNSFNIANGMFGIHVKYARPSTAEMNHVRKYYLLMGYEWIEKGAKLEPVNSMSICNYVQFSGSWTLNNADVSLIEMMKAQFENGVRLWHNNGTPNPMDQNPLDNERVF